MPTLTTLDFSRLTTELNVPSFTAVSCPVNGFAFESSDESPWVAIWDGSTLVAEYDEEGHRNEGAGDMSLSADDIDALWAWDGLQNRLSELRSILARDKRDALELWLAGRPVARVHTRDFANCFDLVVGSEDISGDRDNEVLRGDAALDRLLSPYEGGEWIGEVREVSE